MGDASMTTRISKLRTMSLEELRGEYERVFGKPTKSRNRKQLFGQVARKLQDGAEEEKPGDPIPKPTLVARFEKKRRSKKATKAAGREKKAEAKSEKRSRVKPVGARDPRLPKPGTSLVREWHGKRYVVTVEQEGFTHANKSFRSLSAVAKAICNQIVNGYAWFKLGAKEPQKS